MELPKHTIKELLKKAGVLRPGDSAILEIRKELTNETSRIVSRAKEFAYHAKRKTIKKEDVLLAIEKN